MEHVSGRKAVSGPALIRLLARLTDAGSPAAGQPLADRLGQWLGWTDAIALSAALSGGASAGLSREFAPDHAEDALCARVRATLTNAIARDATLVPHRQRQRDHARHRQNLAATDTAPDYAAFRQCYLSLQEEMESAIGHLRTRLRGLLAGRQPAMARLAAVDAVMERVLGLREHNALAVVPGLLAAHYERLRDAELVARGSVEPAGQGTAQDAGAQDVTPLAVRRARPAQAAQGTQGKGAPAADVPPELKDGPWLDAFRKDLQSVLLAELEIRFQPVEGLRAALRDC